ncbi:hypothetical protein ACPCIR_11460 [Mycobacterium sp. NPDC051198]
MIGIKRSIKSSNLRGSLAAHDESIIRPETEVCQGRDRQRLMVAESVETEQDSLDGGVIEEHRDCAPEEQPRPESSTDQIVDTADMQSNSASKQGVSLRALRCAFALLSGLAMLLAAATGYLKWYDGSIRDAQSARIESVKAATETTVQMLTYHPETVENDLAAARDQMTGAFRDSYTKLTSDVVIPGSKEKHISAIATVPAASSVSASSDHAVVLVFINQAIVVGDDPPSNTASSARVTLDKVDQRWLVSDLTPI